MQWNIPNILTVLRLVAAPGVAIMFLYFQRPWADWFALVLFVSAAITDFLDGYLARLWKQESKFGAMLDPIADKAMVIIALVIIVGLSTADTLVTNQVRLMDPWILLPATVILFREVFVSGLREFLGNDANTLKVTKLAKYKTTFQMIAIAVLFATGIFEHSFVNMIQGMDYEIYDAIMAGTMEDVYGIRDQWWWMKGTWMVGVVLLSIAAVLTAVTGWDYFSKALPFLQEKGK
jgi:CDP-diacylglycerol--glycerol-3-phosphate 3-phosphatidyltransferase